MSQTETHQMSRLELRELAQRCDDFTARFSSWRHPVDLPLMMNDAALLNERLSEYKDLVARAVELQVVDLERMPRGWWPGFDAKITDERHLVASKPTQRAGDYRGANWIKGETYDIPPENLIRFFESAAGMVRNRALNTLRHDALTHGPLVTHESPGGPIGLTVHIR